MKSKLNTILWFVKRPQHIPHIFQILKRRRNQENENTREQSSNWAKENYISKDLAIKTLLGSEYILKDLNSEHGNILEKAQSIIENCPVKMGGQGAIDFIYTLCKGSDSRKIVETGVAYGWSSLAILLAIKENPDAQLISSDMPYIKMNNDDYIGCIIPDELRKKWLLQRLPDVKGIPKALKKMKYSIDLFHYDSDKSYTGRMWASPLIWNALNKGGLFISDDINDNLAFKHFSEKVNRKPIIIKHKGKFVGIIKK